MTDAVAYPEALDRWRAGRARHHEPLPHLDTATLLAQHHRDHDRDRWPTLLVGPNAGEPHPPELARLLHANSAIHDADIAGTTELSSDVLVVGGGGAGCVAALTAAESVDVIVASKLRLGDSNTVMAEGGIQAAVGPDDSLQRHYADTIRGGHDTADREMVAAMVHDGPDAIRWLMDLGMTFDREEGAAADRPLRRSRAGGTTAARVVSFGDATGLEMMRVLREAVRIHPRIRILERTPTVELLTDGNGRCVGAVLHDLERRRLVLTHAHHVILATGGAGQLRLGGSPTSNHLGATADGLALAYRVGARLTGADSFQYHPTGWAWPARVAGHLVSEAARSAGAVLVNGLGDRFVDELAARDVVTAAIARECAEGRGIERDGCIGVFLDTPTVVARDPKLLARDLHTLARLGRRNGVDPATEPVLVAPTLHYQNGGVAIDADGQTTVEGLLAAGEVTGGIHGSNRLMGNALLDVCTFGRRAGRTATRPAGPRSGGPVGIEHLRRWRRALIGAGLPLDEVAPILFALPDDPIARRAAAEPQP